MNMVFIHIDCYLYLFFHVCEKIEDKKNHKLIDKVPKKLLENLWKYMPVNRNVQMTKIWETQILPLIIIQTET